MKKLLSQALNAILITTLVTGCGKKDEEENNGSDVSDEAANGLEILSLADVSVDTSTEWPAVREDLYLQFCKHVYKLSLKSEFKTELSLLCHEGQATDDFRKLDAMAFQQGDDPQPFEISTVHADGTTEAMFAGGYHVPIPPKWVRSGAIHEYMMQDKMYEGVTLNGEVTSDLNSTVGGDLQFAKYVFEYETDVKTPDDTPFQNRRITEFNAYQVHGGNPDIGIGTEHLIDQDNEDFEYFNGITVTIGTESGGSLVLTIIRSKVVNNGYEDEARKAFAYTTHAQVSNVRTGLMSELTPYIIKEGEE